MYYENVKMAVPERRMSRRFPLNFGIRYMYSNRRWNVETYAGVIRDMSSSGLRFLAESHVEVGRRLEVAIQWPALLDGTVPMQMVVTGIVVWSEGNEVALRMQRHEFRTRSTEPAEGERLHPEFRSLQSSEALLDSRQ